MAYVFGYILSTVDATEIRRENHRKDGAKTCRKSWDKTTNLNWWTSDFWTSNNNKTWWLGKVKTPLNVNIWIPGFIHPRCSAWFFQRNHLVSYSEHCCNNSDVVLDFKWHPILMYTILHIYDYMYIYKYVGDAVPLWSDVVPYMLRWIPWFSDFPRGLPTWSQWLIDLTSCRYWKGECDEGHAMQFGSLNFRVYLSWKITHCMNFTTESLL